MKRLLLLVPLVAFAWPAAQASEIGDIYNKVKSSVVIVETTQKDVSPFGMGQLTSVGGLGSGVLVSGRRSAVASRLPVPGSCGTLAPRKVSIWLVKTEKILRIVLPPPRQPKCGMEVTPDSRRPALERFPRSCVPNQPRRKIE